MVLKVNLYDHYKGGWSYWFNQLTFSDNCLDKIEWVTFSKNNIFEGQHDVASFHIHIQSWVFASG